MRVFDRVVERIGDGHCLRIRARRANDGSRPLEERIDVELAIMLQPVDVRVLLFEHLLHLRQVGEPRVG